MFKQFTFIKLALISLMMLSGIATGFSQSRTLTGVVTDAQTGETLIGVNVTFANDNSKGTVTDIDGKYTLQLEAGVKALRFSYVGYSSRVVPLGDANTLNVKMTAINQQLNEVVVVGYGTQKTKQVTSAVSSVKADDFNKGNVTDPIQLIQGKVAGLAISRPGADPNSDFTIRLRGLSTFGGNTQPLIIIDGVQGASLKSVDPDDIASMDVLKDASAAAIYGTKAASGVVIITTKKGKYDPTGQNFHINFNTSLTSESIDRRLNVLTAPEYLQFQNSTDFGSNTDWINTITRPGFSQAYNLAMDGAGKTNSYRVSFNYRAGDGILLKSGYDQWNGHINFSQKALDNMLTFHFNLSATNRNETYGSGDAMMFAARYNPTAPTKADDAFSQEWGGYFQRQAFYFYNPLAILEQNTLDGRKLEVIALAKVDFKPVKFLNFSASYSETIKNSTFGQYWSKNSYWTPYAVGSHNGYARKENQNYQHRLFELTGEFNKQFGKINVKALAGYSYQDDSFDNLWAYGEGFLSDGFLYHNLGSASVDKANKNTMGTYKNGTTLIGFFGRVEANYQDAVFLTANIRRDGSSMFGINNKWGNFAGISGGVNLTKFVKIPYVDRIKIRGGYGETGNLPPYPYLSQLRFNVSNEQFFYNGAYIQAYAPVRNENPDLKWEVKKELNVGIDYYLLNYRISGSIDYYRSRSSDLMLEYTVPVPPYPSDRMWLNLGELENSGIEFAINAKVIDNKKFTWSTSVNFTKYLYTRLLKISNDLTGNQSQQFFGYLGAPFLTGVRSILVDEGKDIGNIIAPIYIGTDSTGRLMYKDVDGDGIFNAQTDYEVVGNGLPKFQLGWGNTFTYGNFYLNFFFRGVFGHSLVNVNNARYGVPVVIGIQSGMEQALDYLDAKNGPVYSNVHVEKADFVKLDNFSLGYTFKFKDNKYVNGLKVFLSGQNLFTITNYSGVDPEVRYGDAWDNNNPLAPGIDRETTYFTSRSLTFGVNVLF
jgi:TonB-linked SusC/RagA family outer membrane protein